MLSIISIVYGSLPDIQKTCLSVNMQSSEKYEHIVVASGLAISDRESLVVQFRSDRRIFIFDQDKSIYNAMNVGLSHAKGRWVLFLNGGDTLIDVGAISLIYSKQSANKCVAFSTIQRFEQDLYIRPPCNIKNKKIIGWGHQGFVSPLNSCRERRIYYNESNLVSADQEWMRDCVSLYGLDCHNEVLSELALGGLSNKPSIKLFNLHLKSKEYKSALRTIPKIALYRLFGARFYYCWLAKLNRYKKLDRSD